MNVLILSQKVSDLHISILQNALPEGCCLDIITGSELEKYKYIASPAHDPRSLKSRVKCWISYYRFVMKWVKQNQDNKYDLIFATSNPPINGLLGVKIKKRLNAPFIYMNWDLYPQVIEMSMQGVIPKAVSWMWNKLNNAVYPKIDQMVTIGKVMGETLNDPLKDKVDVKIIPMFTDTSRLKPIDKHNNQFCISNHWEDKFIVLFSGKMGLGHNIEIMLEASKILKEYKDILFVFIGHGQKYEIVERWITTERAENVALLPLQPEDIFPYSMACGDIGFISQEKEMARAFMPAKTYDMMACGMAILAYADGTDDLSRLVYQNNLGMVITENDANKMANAILSIYQNPDIKKEYGINARNLAEKMYDIKPVTERYRLVFDEVLTRK